ncbi:chemotaxis protein CheA, partial [Pseudoduganella ginsengisoli]
DWLAAHMAARAAGATAAAGGGERRGEDEGRFGRRADDVQIGKVLKVDQAKVERMMDLIGEMVVAKNSLPYLANRAENQFGVRELARDIKAQYAVINRIAEEMQDAIMQVRMMPVSVVLQRFPRLVRDISRRLGKEVELVLEGEDTEADKNIVEVLADPLMHMVRNSLDHGFEMPEQRLASGKPRCGRLLIRAVQESDRVRIEVCDDGRGIDPEQIRRKAVAKGIIDEAQAERLTDAQAQELVFAPGFSTADAITDLSGRGVGMDVVRTALSNAGGTLELHSVPGAGTTLRLSLPLSVAVTNVMVVESDGQIFGVPMDLVVESVRLPMAAIRSIKQSMTTVLRGAIVPLVALNSLLALPAEPQPNADDELAALVVRAGGERVGLLVDQFRGVIDVLLKPLPGELGRMACYAGSALLGDGSVLMVLNPKELL